jgi:hypothetical protein
VTAWTKSGRQRDAGDLRRLAVAVEVAVAVAVEVEV